MGKTHGTPSVNLGLFGKFDGAVTQQLASIVASGAIDRELIKGYIKEEGRLNKALRAGLLPQKPLKRSVQQSILAELVEQLKAQGGTGSELSTVSGDGNITADIARVIICASLPGGVAYPVTVDYADLLSRGKTDDERFRFLIEQGRYDWVNWDILKAGFTIKGTGSITTAFGLYWAKRDISSDKLIAEIDPLEFRPATAVETLAFGAKYPDIQRKFPVIGLGSVGQLYGGRRVLYLDHGGTERGCHLNWYDYGWDGNCRFLVAHKQA